MHVLMLIRLVISKVVSSSLDFVCFGKILLLLRKAKKIDYRVSRSSTKDEYHAMTSTTSGIVRLH